MTLSDFQGNSPNACLFKCEFSYSYAAVLCDNGDACTHCVLQYCAAALRNFAKSAPSKDVRDKATGALFILENKDQQKNRPKTAARGLYSLQLASPAMGHVPP